MVPAAALFDGEDPEDIWVSRRDVRGSSSRVLLFPGPCPPTADVAEHVARIIIETINVPRGAVSARFLHSPPRVTSVGERWSPLAGKVALGDVVLKLNDRDCTHFSGEDLEDDLSKSKNDKSRSLTIVVRQKRTASPNEGGGVPISSQEKSTASSGDRSAKNTPKSAWKRAIGAARAATRVKKNEKDDSKAAPGSTPPRGKSEQGESKTDIASAVSSSPKPDARRALDAPASRTLRSRAGDNAGDDDDDCDGQVSRALATFANRFPSYCSLSSG